MVFQHTYPIPPQIILQISRLAEEYLHLHHHLGGRQVANFGILGSNAPPQNAKEKVVLNLCSEDVELTWTPKQSSGENIILSSNRCHWQPPD